MDSGDTICPLFEIGKGIKIGRVGGDFSLYFSLCRIIP